MSGDPGIETKIKELTQLESWKKQFHEHPDVCWLNTLKPETQAALEEDVALKDLAVDVQSLHVHANNIRTQALRESRSFSIPTPTLEDRAKQVRNLTIVVLNSNIEGAQVETELFDEAIHILEGGIAESVKKEILAKNEVSIVYRRMGYSWGKRICGEIEWDRHEKESKEQIKILEVAKLWHQKLIDIFRAAIQERESHNGESSKKKILN